MKTLKDYIIYHINDYSLKRAAVERSTGISINNLQKFPPHYTGPSLKDVCDLLSLDEVDTYSKYQYLPVEAIELLFDPRFLEFFIFMSRTDQKTREELFKILERLLSIDREGSDQP